MIQVIMDTLSPLTLNLLNINSPLKIKLMTNFCFFIDDSSIGDASDNDDPEDETNTLNASNNSVSMAPQATNPDTLETNNKTENKEANLTNNSTLNMQTHNGETPTNDANLENSHPSISHQ